MATYAELHEFQQANGGFSQRVMIACVIAAHAVSAESDTTPNHAARLKWASAVMRSPDVEAARMLWFVLAHGGASTIAQIQALTDAEIQDAVNSGVDLFALG